MDWICKTRTRKTQICNVVKLGLVKGGFVKQGLVKREFVRRGLVKRRFVML